MSQKPSCATCRYFQAGPAQNAGECRRYAPTRSERGGSQWPLILASAWCGEYQPREAEQ